MLFFYKLLPLLLLVSCNGEHIQRTIDGDLEPRLPNFYERIINKADFDSDKDGVIDEMEVWINMTVNDTNLRMAFKQYVKNYFLVVENGPSGASRGSPEKTLESYRCVLYFLTVLYPDSSKRLDIHESFKSELHKVANKIQKDHNLILNSMVAGSSYEGEKKITEYWEYCEFKIKNFENYKIQ